MQGKSDSGHLVIAQGSQIKHVKSLLGKYAYMSILFAVASLVV